MLPLGWLVAALLAVAVVSAWVTFTLARLERLYGRIAAARASLDAQLVRRAAALAHALETAAVEPIDRERYAALARTALDPRRSPDDDDAARRVVENAVGRAVADLTAQQAAPEPPSFEELREAATRVLISRRFYNDAVRDTRALRAGALPRLLGAAGISAARRRPPDFFDIDDTPPPRRPDSAPCTSRAKEDTR